MPRPSAFADAARPPPIDPDAAADEAVARRRSQTHAHPPHHHHHHNNGGGDDGAGGGSSGPSSPLSTRAASLRDCFECGVPSRLALSIVVLGASGDLARKKTYPALFALYAKGFAPANAQVLGYARSALTDEALREQIRPHLKGDAKKVEAFLQLCRYVHGDVRATR